MTAMVGEVRLDESEWRTDRSVIRLSSVCGVSSSRDDVRRESHEMGPLICSALLLQ